MKSSSEFSIFIVDDDPFFSGLCTQMLKNLDFKNVTCFHSGTEFLHNVQLNPDIILLDYNMESMNGIETLKKLKRFNPNLLVVFISGQEDIEIAVSALKYGAFDYLIKNQITEARLKVLIEKGVALKALIRKGFKKTVFSRVLSTIGIPILLWFLLQIFFK